MSQDIEPTPILTPPPEARPMDILMEQTRRKYAAEAPSGLASVGLIPTPEDLDYYERMDAAVAVSECLISGAQKRLAAPVFTPLELTPAENAENASTKAWQHGYDVGNKLNEKLLKDNDKLFDATLRMIEELNINRLPVPADLDLPSPIVIPTSQLDIPLNTHLWLGKRHNFREHSNGDFQAARSPERGTLTSTHHVEEVYQSPGVRKSEVTVLKNGERRRSKFPSFIPLEAETSGPKKVSRLEAAPQAGSSRQWQRLALLDISAKW